MAAGVFIAGLGAIAGIGNNVAACLNALKQGEAGIGDIRYLQTNHRGILPVAEVKLSNTQLAELCGLPADSSRTALLSCVAAKEALEDSGVQNIPGLRIGFVSANTAGGIDKTEDFSVDFIKHGKGKLREVLDHGSGNITTLVADQLGIKDHISTISTACSSSAQAIMFAARMIKHNMLDAVVAGGTDALTRFSLNGFNTLLVVDEQLCQPFDENRRGLNLGEGAGYVVLVSDKVAALLDRKPYCQLTGYANANDAYHQTSTSPEGNGPYQAMKDALAISGLQPADIGYINLHGTGTLNNDSSEGEAVKRLFEPYYPKMSTTKAYTGHTLGASAGVEAVFSVLSVQNGYIYPNLRLQAPIADLPFVPETEFAIDTDISHVMSNSFGFGGNCSSLIFSKV